MKYYISHHPSATISRARQVKQRYRRTQVIPINLLPMPDIEANHVIYEITPPYRDSNLKEIKYQKSEGSTTNKTQTMNDDTSKSDVQSIPKSTTNCQTNVQTLDTDQKSTSVVIESQHESSPLPQKIPMNENDLKYQTKRQNKYSRRHCHQCSLLLIYLTAIAFILIASAITATVIAFNQLKVTTTTTTTTSTTTTSTTTTSTTTTSTTTTSTTTTRTTSTTSTTTTARPFVSLLSSGDYIIGVYDTVAGGSSGGVNGEFSGGIEYPTECIDGSLSTKYLNYGSNTSGINTGFYVRPTISAATIARSLLFATAYDFPNRDPITVTLEGTNSTSFDVGSSWTFIYNGATGIDSTTTPSRSTYGTMQNFSNTIAYKSYRLLITSKRAPDNSVQYSEAQIWGYYY